MYTPLTTKQKFAKTLEANIVFILKPLLAYDIDVYFTHDYKTLNEFDENAFLYDTIESTIVETSIKYEYHYTYTDDYDSDIRYISITATMYKNPEIGNVQTKVIRDIPRYPDDDDNDEYHEEIISENIYDLELEQHHHTL